MEKSQNQQNKYPHQNPSLFRTNIQQASAETGFVARLIEKDYYCSLILRELYSDVRHPLIFKGGTLLNKVYAGFYRLSEDLDFSISTPPDSTRGQRSKLVKPIKELINNIQGPGLTLKAPLEGSNNSSQYNAKFQYQSCLSEILEVISFEIGIREEILQTPVVRQANTLISDRFSKTALIEPIQVTALTLGEAYAEKLRAALTRKTPAIRDVFDIYHACQNNVFQFDGSEFQQLVVRKIAAVEKLVVDLSLSRKQLFETQLQSELEPVLRPQDFNQFDFNFAWNLLCQLGKPYQFQN